VGSVSAAVWAGEHRRGFATTLHGPSAFSRSGFGIWDEVKPEVVEIGGDFAFAPGNAGPPTIETATAVELLRTTGDGGPTVARDGVGTSYAAPKVTHLAARLQRQFPTGAALLYRALIVHSARWPEWAIHEAWDADSVLRLIGYGLPSIDRATENAPNRITFITPQSVSIRNQELHLYRVAVPSELRTSAEDIPTRMDVTLSYSSEPRRTRASRRGYLATWLDWRSSGLGEPMDSFRKRMISGEETPSQRYKQPEWCLHFRDDRGKAVETHRTNGTVQKDWAKVAAHELPDEFLIAVRAHKGWDHREGSGGAKYCLAVSLEAEDISVPVYATVSAANVEVQPQIEPELSITFMMLLHWNI
jgi:hypothetical protein